MLLLSPGMVLLMGSHGSTGSGPAKYGLNRIEIPSVISDRFCHDLAGAQVVIEGTYIVVGTDEELSGSALGEQYSLPLKLDGRAESEIVVLDNDDDIATWADCSALPLGGTGSMFCRRSESCTAGDRVTFSYASAASPMTAS